MRVINLHLILMTMLASSWTDGFVTPFVRMPLNNNNVKTLLFMAEKEETTSELKRLPDSAVELTLKIPGHATEAAYEAACRQVTKDVTIPGFRKGAKIPRTVLEMRMKDNGAGQMLQKEAIKALINKLIQPALKDDHGLEPIGQPTLILSESELADQFIAGEPIHIGVKCDVWPEIKWLKEEEEEAKPYVGLKGSYQRQPFDQKKLDQALLDLRERYAVLEDAPEGKILEMGDACNVNMEGYMALDDEGTQKGAALPNAASGDNVQVILEKGRYMTGLIEGIVGKKVGEKTTVVVSFPDKLKDKTLAGKRAIFDVSILSASTRTLPEVTDEFASKVRAGLTAEGLMDELQKAVDAEDAKKFTPARNAALGKSLAAVVDVEIPDTLVTNQAREKFAMMMTDMRSNGVADEEIKRQINPENFLKYKAIVKDDIVRDFKVSMATDEIARLEGIQVPDYQIEEQMEQIRADKQEGDEKFDEALVRSQVEMTIQRQMVFDYLADNGDLEVQFQKEEEFDEELMNKLMQDSLEREKQFADESQ